MTEAAKYIKLVIGLESHMLPQEELEEVQLVTADGEHFALIEQHPLWENAEFIVKTVNNHDALVAALEAAYDQLPCVCGDNFETCDCAVAKVTAALSEQVK